MSKGSVDDGVVFHAGFPNAAEDAKFGSLSLDALVVKHRASTFFWRLEADVEELSWTAGSVVVVDRALEPKVGSLAVVVVDDDFVLARYRERGFESLTGLRVNGELWGVVTYAIQKLC